MPDRGFLETFSLYRKFPTKIPSIIARLETPTLKMSCSKCGNEQTFTMRNDFSELHHREMSPAGLVLRAMYVCVGCDRFNRLFFIYFDSNGQYMMKVGQEPPWEIAIDKNLEEILGDHVDYYKKGLVCESHGYGIGAFSYYRRIVEEIIDHLLDEISSLLRGDEKKRYSKALSEVRSTTVAQEKIEHVKDLLPPILRPHNVNPLSILHQCLSEGLHSQSDEECMEIASEIRESLVFLVNQVLSANAASTSYSDKIKKLLDRRAERGKKLEGTDHGAA